VKNGIREIKILSVLREFHGTFIFEGNKYTVLFTINAFPNSINKEDKYEIKIQQIHISGIIPMLEGNVKDVLKEKITKMINQRILSKQLKIR